MRNSCGPCFEPLESLVYCTVFGRMTRLPHAGVYAYAVRCTLYAAGVSASGLWKEFSIRLSRYCAWPHINDAWLIFSRYKKRFNIAGRLTMASGASLLLYLHPQLKTCKVPTCGLGLRVDAEPRGSPSHMTSFVSHENAHQARFITVAFPVDESKCSLSRTPFYYCMAFPYKCEN